RHDEAVLVRGPDGAVATQETRAGALFAAEADRAIEQSRREPFEAHRNLAQRPLELRHHAIDEPARDERLAHRRGAAPTRTMGEKVTDGHGEVVVGIEQAR